MLGRKKEGAWKTRDVVVKFEHLNPLVQQGLIGKAKESDTEAPSIRSARRGKTFINAAYGSFGLSLGALFTRSPSPVMAAGFAPLFHVYYLAKKAMLQQIQITHDKLVQTIKRNGLLQTRFEGNYPRDWINPVIVEKTHPIFHVKRNGDIVFYHPTQLEYARMKFQEKFPGRVLGLNPWRWRAYLKKPEAPEKVRAWAKRKVSEWAEKLKPVPLPKPVPAYGKRMFRPALRRRFAR